jgi:UV DNA damage repair endonuclease
MNYRSINEVGWGFYIPISLDSRTLRFFPAIHPHPGIEVEAKHKEETIAHLRSCWLMGK